MGDGQETQVSGSQHSLHIKTLWELLKNISTQSFCFVLFHFIDLPWSLGLYNLKAPPGDSYAARAGKPL